MKSLLLFLMYSVYLFYVCEPFHVNKVNHIGSFRKMTYHDNLPFKYDKVSRIRKMFDTVHTNNTSDNSKDDDDDEPLIFDIPFNYGTTSTPRRKMNIPHQVMQRKSKERNKDHDESEDNEDNEEMIRKIFGIPKGMKVYRLPNPDAPNQHDESYGQQSKTKKSENFEVIENPEFSFRDIGGYEEVKNELIQMIDILRDFERYSNYSVRTPKGLLLEGPPGNGKTLLAKAFSGEVNSSFISVSGSQFTEKYVGVGASRIRELFRLARENKPCIIFIDEIDALGRSRVTGEQNSNVESQSTLNELLVSMDGYASSDGIFVVGATNRADLLDNALVRPGRIDKKVYIGNPDAKTRANIIEIHVKGKPFEEGIQFDDLVDMTNGLSGAEIENLLNEAMLHALRMNKTRMGKEDLDVILSRMLVGYQSSENSYSDDMIKRIAIHELGHAVVGLLSSHHANLVKICLNTWSPRSPGYTIFESAETDTSIYTKERLTSRLMVLLAGRIAEEVFFGASITSGASKDIEDAYGIAEQMIVKFGMGKKMIYPYHSEMSKSSIDRDIELLIKTAYESSHSIVMNNKKLIEECADELILKKMLYPDYVVERMNA